MEFALFLFLSAPEFFQDWWISFQWILEATFVA